MRGTLQFFKIKKKDFGGGGGGKGSAGQVEEFFKSFIWGKGRGGGSGGIGME